MNCDNQVAENWRKKIVVDEIWGGIKKNVTFTIFSQ